MRVCGETKPEVRTLKHDEDAEGLHMSRTLCKGKVRENAVSQFRFVDTEYGRLYATGDLGRWTQARHEVQGCGFHASFARFSGRHFCGWMWMGCRDMASASARAGVKSGEFERPKTLSCQLATPQQARFVETRVLSRESEP